MKNINGLESLVTYIMEALPEHVTSPSDNFLQRATERLDESGSESAVRLFGYIILELLHIRNRDE